MAEYIEREKIYADISRLLICKSTADLTNCEDGWTSAISKAMDVIKDVLAADVRPERHGEWIFDKPNAIGYFPVKCSSKCGFKIAITGCPCDWINEPDHVYCGACGAKMDGGKNNETD